MEFVQSECPGTVIRVSESKILGELAVCLSMQHVVFWWQRLLSELRGCQ